LKMKEITWQDFEVVIAVPARPVPNGAKLG
jgi:hypothetical protein